MVAFREFRIRIIKVPPGEAPFVVREKWVGLELPLPLGHSHAQTVQTCGVISGLAEEKATLGYSVEIEDAVRMLEHKSPEAAAWWRQHAAHLFTQGGSLVFHAHVCELVHG